MSGHDNKDTLSLSKQQVLELYNKQLEHLLTEIRPREFLQVERIGQDKVVAEVAQRFTGEMDKFRKQATDMVQDAVEALREGQTLRLTISSS
jgi:hypothetical protein